MLCPASVGCWDAVPTPLLVSGGGGRLVRCYAAALELGCPELACEQGIQALAALVCSTKGGAIHNHNALSSISVW